MEQTYDNDIETSKPASQAGRGDTAIDIADLLHKYLRYWYWFVIGLVIALGVAYWYIHSTPKVFNVYATVQIKEDKSGISGLQQDILKQITLSSNNSNIQNEIVILKSHTLISRVVKALGLQVAYVPENRPHDAPADLYKKSPVLVHPVKFEGKSKGITLYLSTKNNQTFTVSDGNKKVSVSIEGIAHLSSGDFMVLRNPDGMDSAFQKLTVVISPLDKVASGYAGRLSVSQTDKMSSSLSLKINTTIPERGQDFLNGLLNEYQKMGLVEKNEMATNTIHFVSTRLDSLMGELDSVESQMADFMSGIGMADIDEQSKLFLGQVGQVEDMLTQAQMKRNALQEIMQYMKRPPSESLMVPSTLGIADPTLLALIQQYNAAQLDRSRQLQAGMKPSHPIIQGLDHQIHKLRKGIKENIQNIEKGVAITIQELEKKSKGFESKIREVPGLQKHFLAIKRKHEVKQALYNYLLQKREEASLTKEASVNNSIVVDPAMINAAPVSPKRKVIYLAALILGLAIPGGLLYLKELFNNKVSSKKEIEELTTIPIYAEIMSGEKDTPLVVMSGLRSHISEQFRNLRTNLNFAFGRDNNKKCILVTSGTSGEGKSFVALNLAMSYALLGKRTVLLDFDLRRPKLQRYLSLDKNSKNRGISDYLSGETTPEELPEELTFGEHNLYFVNSGSVPPNPAELMLDPAMDHLMDYLRAHFDYIILDTPPIGIVADAQILAKYADTTLCIVRHEYTQRENVRMLDGLYHEKKLPKMGIILNDIDSKDAYRYGYYYYSGYYTYGEQEKSSVYQKIKEGLKRH